VSGSMCAPNMLPRCPVTIVPFRRQARFSHSTTRRSSDPDTSRLRFQSVIYLHNLVAASHNMFSPAVEIHCQ
jgi:hypothetical protein